MSIKEPHIEKVSNEVKIGNLSIEIARLNKIKEVIKSEAWPIIKSDYLNRRKDLLNKFLSLGDLRLPFEKEYAQMKVIQQSIRDIDAFLLAYDETAINNSIKIKQEKMSEYSK